MNHRKHESEFNRPFHGPEPGLMVRRENWTHGVPPELLGWAPPARGFYFANEPEGGYETTGYLAPRNRRRLGRNAQQPAGVATLFH